LGGRVVHVVGLPVQTPAQQSPSVLQSPFSGTHGDVHTSCPCAFGEHSPRQQSALTMQGADGSRHPPGPRSQRPIPASALQTPEQQLAPLEQASPVGKQPLEGDAHVCWKHLPEQQSESLLQCALAGLHCEPPQMPPLQASEQQENDSVHWAPSRLQKLLHKNCPRRPCGSQRELQHSVRVEHGTPGPSHVPDGRQTPFSQR
jgi:hypothetical protein